ncbi:hypothetical protein [Chryseobacterium luteum]|uniref:Uncharacterized protein n=1 Tax=Chryseobacterium luteum TaxID=421531 RepID=A0A085ZV30_9FLAO|nr:hypothetical protein [Chryseobacterium luteum]KFF08294.1 hypothetical protein IX38_05860 [Chryseobacterium luteum]
MKFLLTILIFLFFNYCFGQNDLEIKIVNDTIKKGSYYDRNNIAYTITNNSNKTYLLILDSAKFNEADEYVVEPFFIGLPDYYVYENNTLLNPMLSFGGGSNIYSEKEDTNTKEFRDFHKRFGKTFDDYEMKIAYRISKKTITLKPKEEKTFITQIDFPYYRGRYFNLKNKSTYFFQISLQNPNEIISKYLKVLGHKGETSSIFTGQIYSNKIPLIYEVYNNP